MCTERLIDSCRGKQSYTDADFPPQPESIGAVDGKTPKEIEASIVWKRVDEIIGKKGSKTGAMLFSGESRVLSKSAVTPGWIRLSFLASCHDHIDLSISYQKGRTTRSGLSNHVRFGRVTNTYPHLNVDLAKGPVNL